MAIVRQKECAIPPRQKPSCDYSDREDEQQETNRVAVRCGVLVDRHQWDGLMDGVQRDCRGDSDHCQHRNDNPGADARAGLSVRARIRHERTPYLWQLNFSGKTSTIVDIVSQQVRVEKASCPPLDPLLYPSDAHHLEP
jgi:hypothetical protein